MKSIFTTILIFGSILSSASSAPESFEELVTQMQDLRNKIGADEIIAKYSGKIEKEYSGKIYSRTQRITLDSSVNREQVSLFGYLNYGTDFRQKQEREVSFQTTKYFLDEKSFLKQQQKLAIKSARAVRKIRKHIEKNIDDIVRLKFLHAFALKNLAEHTWEGSIFRLNIINRLGNLVSFFGSGGVRYCTTVSHPENSYYDSLEEAKSNSASIVSFFSRFFTSGKKKSKKLVKRVNYAYEESKCQLKNEKFEVQTNTSSYAFNLELIDQKISELLEEVYLSLVFELSPDGHIFSFDNSYFTEDTGNHPFEN